MLVFCDVFADLFGFKVCGSLYFYGFWVDAGVCGFWADVALA